MFLEMLKEKLKEEEPQVSPILRLPLELRQHIYSYILPRTTDATPVNAPIRPVENLCSLSSTEFALTHGLPPVRRKSITDLHKRATQTSKEHGVVWLRGCTALLAVCQQIHEECADMMYGWNTFVIDVAYDGILFKYRWLMPSRLTPPRDIPFLDHFSQKNLKRIKNYIINVELVDSYTGMVKYNCSNGGLTSGIRHQVRQLADVMCMTGELRQLHVHLADGNKAKTSTMRGRMYPVMVGGTAQNPQTVLDPFLDLKGVRKLSVTGAVTDDYSDVLQRCIAG